MCFSCFYKNRDDVDRPVVPDCYPKGKDSRIVQRVYLASDKIVYDGRIYQIRDGLECSNISDTSERIKSKAVGSSQKIVQIMGKRSD